MNALVPLISARTVGPLGLAHLPRLWLKMRLSAKGMLAEGYRAGIGRFDGMLFDALGIDPAAATAFVETSQPDYPVFENWIRENANPESLTDGAIDEFNKGILLRPKSEEGRTEMLEALGLPQSDREWTVSDLNDLDDWRGFHLALLDE